MWDLQSVSRTRIIRSEEDSGICSGEYRGNTEESGRYQSGSPGSPAPLKVITIAPLEWLIHLSGVSGANPSIWHFRGVLAILRLQGNGKIESILLFNIISRKQMQINISF